MKNILPISITTIISCALLGIVLVVMNSCMDARDQYYRAQKECVQNGGSWVPAAVGGDNYNAFCLRLK